MDSQQARHARVPIALSQIRALEQAALTADSRVQSSTAHDQIGHVLTSNMLATFAIELGLKAFYLSFSEGKPPSTHWLAALYRGLPARIRGDIAATYASDLPDLPVVMFALKASPVRPTIPDRASGGGYGDADAFFESTSKAFIAARYFFEQVDGADWSVIDHPIDYMLRMSDVLRIVYEEYAKRGGFGDDHFRTISAAT